MPAFAPTQTDLFNPPTDGPISTPARAVIQALANPEWDFRTIDGIAKETGMTPEQVAEVIKEYPQHIRKSLAKGRESRDLYTLRSKPRLLTEKLAFIRSILT